MADKNNAAWLDKAGASLEVRSADIGKPGADEVLIKVRAIALNPVDYFMRDYGILVQNWPTILGTDLAGEVEEVGSDVTDLKKGQRVLALAVVLKTGRS